MGRSLEEDPLTLAIAPPSNETPEERQAREAAEREARRISDEIDEQLNKERVALKRRKRPIKVLLLGQSESGKSATLKNFQLTYASNEWSEERASWRCVIQMNLVRNVNDILELISRELSSSPTASDEDSENTGVRTNKRALKFGEKHRLLKLRLGPLRKIQADLEERLGSASQELYTTTVFTAAPFESSIQRKALQEFSINSNNGWKSALEKFRNARPFRAEIGPDSARRGKSDGDEITTVIASCKDDMKSLWTDQSVQDMLTRRKTWIQESPGFFLNDVDRIATPNYQPSDGDVVRARLRTVGVQEYSFVFQNGRTAGQEWKLFDVGGTRSSRAAWYPYFDDVNAIIFLAPISCFDEKLAEDRRVNRLEDSYLLWRSVVACKLLSKTQVILFLNKCDLLESKLKRGIRIKENVPTYGERKNDLPTAIKYFEQHFREISKQFSPVARPFYCYTTSVVDTTATAVTLAAVEESILRDHLRRADLM